MTNGLAGCLPVGFVATRNKEMLNFAKAAHGNVEANDHGGKRSSFSFRGVLKGYLSSIRPTAERPASESFTPSLSISTSRAYVPSPPAQCPNCGSRIRQTGKRESRWSGSQPRCLLAQPASTGLPKRANVMSVSARCRPDWQLVAYGWDGPLLVL